MRTRIVIALLSLALFGCPKKTADLELDAARKALADKDIARARKCAGELVKSAEQKLEEARALADKGEIDDAKAKAAEAEALARQAKNSSPAGCDEPPKEEPKPEEPKSGEQASTTMADLSSVEQTIYFDFNQANIREDSKALLNRVADLMRQDKALRVEIEGHCDTRGSTEYNLHLGERRAGAVKKYLVTQGVDENRLMTISYGEERPVDDGETEEAHQRNRRAQLRKP